MELGDAIESALTSVGITKDRVSTWLGKECNCEERKQKLNRLSAWARQVTKGKLQQAEKFLNKITEE